MGDERTERIRQRAYDYWQEEGRPYGRHREHWLRAERDIAEEERRSGHPLEQHHEHPVESVEITTGLEPLEEHIKRTEGP